jgi:ABC-type transporter Mla subunit MlaD
MPRPARWRDLHGGVVSVFAVLGAALSILFFGNVNSLHGSTIRLYAAVGTARGVLRGTEVWLYGRRVGLVEDVSFLSSNTDTLRRLVVAMNVLDRYRDNIRKDAEVQIRKGASPLGAPVVYLNSGSASARVISDGDTIVGVPQNDFEEITSEFAIASRDFPAIINNVKIIGRSIRSAQSTFGAFGIDKGGPELDAAQVQLRRLGRKLDAASGTIGRALNSRPTLIARASAALARADSVRSLVSTGRAAMGRFRSDTTLLTQIQDVRSEIAIIRALMRSPNNDVGRFAADSAAFRALGDAQREMTLLFNDVKQHPMRYVQF